MIIKEIRIVSGGQSGVDRAALDVAEQLGILRGGWCPKGRLAEDGPISEEYPLTEAPSAMYEQRTMWNVRDADATVIVARGLPLSGGTQYTRTVAEGLHKPYLVVSLDSAPSIAVTTAWLRRNKVVTLNVAGPRESGQPGIYQEASAFLRDLFQFWRSQVEKHTSSEII